MSGCAPVSRNEQTVEVWFASGVQEGHQPPARATRSACLCPRAGACLPSSAGIALAGSQGWAAMCGVPGKARESWIMGGGTRDDADIPQKVGPQIYIKRWAEMIDWVWFV